MKEIKKRKPPLPVALALICLTGIALSGCSAKTEITKQEQDNFKGGPMPPGYMAEADRRKAAAEKNVPANYKAWQDQRNAELKHGAPANATPLDTPSH